MIQFCLGSSKVTLRRGSSITLQIGDVVVGHLSTKEQERVDYHCNDLQVFTLHAAGENRLGGVKPLSKAPAWAIVGDEIADLHPSDDGSSCVVEPTKTGACTITVSDTDDSGVPPFVVNLTVNPSPIVALVVTADPPVDKTA